MTEPANRNPAAETGWGDLIRRRGGVLGLICLAVWLNAADALVTATVMPDVARDLGGLRYFSLAFSGFMVGSVAASASAGWLAERLGLGRAAAAAGLILAIGCGVSAASGGAEAFLADGMDVTLEMYDEKPISVQLPEQVEATIVEADAVVKGQTASSSYKPAVLENGVRVMVPPHIESGTRIVVDVYNREYVRKAD